MDVLGVQVVIGQFEAVVITKLPEDGPRGFMTPPLDKQRVKEQETWKIGSILPLVRVVGRQCGNVASGRLLTV